MNNTFTQLHLSILLLLTIIITSTANAQPPSTMTAGTYTLTDSFTWYDSGGQGGGVCPSTAAGNYADNLNIIETITANTCQQIVVIWVAATFGIAAGDTLRVYNGPNTTYPVMAVYTNTSIPIPATLGATTSNSITFSFTSDSSDNCKGWQANVSAHYFMQQGNCNFSCSGTYTFIDPQNAQSGGPGGDATCIPNGGNSKDYRDSVNLIETFTTDSGQCIQIDPTFPSNFGICSGDTLKVFDGPSIFSAIANGGAAVYTNTFSNPAIFSTLDNSVTYKFVTDGTNHTRGWQISMSCVNCPVASSINNVCSNANKVNVYPNPTLDYFNINTVQLDPQSVIYIYDLTGRLVESDEVNGGEMKVGKILFNGVYFLKIEANDEMHNVIKLVKSF